LQESRSRTLEEDLATSPVREAALAYASALLSSASRREGLVLLEKIVAASPSWLLAYEVMFTHYLDQGSAFLAEKVARRALAYANDEAGARPSILLARALRARSRPGEALAALRGAEARFPSESGITLWTGVVLHDAGFLTEACERFSSAYQRSRGDEHAAYNHAACLVRAERWGEARDVVKLALKQHPGSASLRLLAGNANRMLGHDADAYLAWRGFLDVAHPRDPRRAQVENALADLRTAGVDRGARPTP
jgi:tetratricopeptide (TPR) repeat protein